jgi:Xaa-Pro dipeptidase
MQSQALELGTNHRKESQMDELGTRDKIQGALEDSQYDGLILTGSDNMRYAIGAKLPFLSVIPEQRAIVIWPKRSSATCLCTSKWESTIGQLSWIQKLESFADFSSPDAVAREAARILRDTIDRGAQIGVDVAQGSHILVTELEKHLPEMELMECDGWFQRVRAAKTSQERALLEDIASRVDHGILGAVHHLCIKTPMSEKRLAEEVRIHCLERGIDVAGYESFSQVASGPHGAKFWPLAPKYGTGWDRMPGAGELVRVEMRAMLEGYWCDAARMVTMGPPDKDQRQTYEGLVSLRRTALQHLAPGRKCSEIFEVVAEEARMQGMRFVNELGVGHGVGVSLCESPFLTKRNETELAAGMVLVLDPVIYGPNREIVRSKDTVIVTESGCRVVGWYKNWDEPYVTAYTF